MFSAQTVQVVNKETGEITNYTEEEYRIERDRRLMDWDAKVKALAAAKDAEMLARKAAVAFMHDDSKTGTTENVELGGGYKATFKVPVKYGFIKNAEGKVDKARIEKALAKIESLGGVGELVAERLVKWTPELSLTEYKLLDAKHKKIIDDVIVTSDDGAPSLEIKAPKSK